MSGTIRPAIAARLVDRSAHADPSAEIPLVLATLAGDVELTSKRGRRRLPAQQFFQSALVTARRPDELVTSLRWPVRRPTQRFAFTEFAVRSGDYAIVAVACVLDLPEDGAVRSVRLGFGGASEVPQIIDVPDLNKRLEAERSYKQSRSMRRRAFNAVAISWVRRPIGASSPACSRPAR